MTHPNAEWTIAIYLICLQTGPIPVRQVEEGMKLCNDCGDIKPQEEFYARKHADGSPLYATICKICQIDRDKIRRQKRCEAKRLMREALK